MRLYKLKFYSALHVDARGSGEPEVAEEFIRSDTLSAAICIAWSSVFPDDGLNFLNPPFRVASAFPYIGDALFFPVPVWQIWNKETMDDLKRKEMKKVRWLSQALFRHVLEGQEIEADSITLLPGGVAVYEADINAHPQLNKTPFWVITERQRVSIDRLNLPQEGGLFFFALQFFAPDSGLWFVADADDFKKLRSVMDYLGDTGIGADRNSGLGHFKVAGEMDFPLRSDPERAGWIILSLFNPDTSEKLESLTSITAYELTTRSGWVSNSTVGRPPVRAFTEGSFFSGKPVGRVVETLSQEIITDYELPISHTAPRDFRAISLPCATPPYLKGGQP